MKTIISNIETLLDSNLKNKGKTLEEKKVEKMCVPIISNKATYLSYTFDVDDNNNYPKGMFPFFNAIEKARSICDYVIFAAYKKVLYVLLIELKKGKLSTTNQLQAGENFSRFIISSCNRIFKTNINPEVRKITIRYDNITKKGTTKKTEVEYDESNSTTFKGKTFFLEEFLK